MYELETIITRIADDSAGTLGAAAGLIASQLKQGAKLLVCGNGGSAAQASHFAAELVSRWGDPKAAPGLPAIALTADQAFLTAWANDHGYVEIFARQVQVLGQGGDVLLAISTSGESPNVLQAVHAARQMGMHIIGLGGVGGSLQAMVDLYLMAPSKSTPHIQEAHLPILHLLQIMVRDNLKGSYLEAS